MSDEDGCVWRVRTFKGFPMSDDQNPAPMFMDDTPSITLDKDMAPRHDLYYGPVALGGDPAGVAMFAPNPITEEEIEAALECDGYVETGMLRIRVLHRPTFEFDPMEPGVILSGIEEGADGSTRMATWFVSPFEAT